MEIRKLAVFGSLFFWVLFSCAHAAQILPTNAIWDLEVSHGSNQDSNGGSGSIPYTDFVEVHDSTSYAYSSFEADFSSLEAYVQGFSEDTDPYEAYASVTLLSLPFSNDPLFSLSFGWTTVFDFDADKNAGEATISVGIFDLSTVSNVYQRSFSVFDTDSGSFSVSWFLDPTHQYLYYVSTLANISGAEDPQGGSVEVRIYDLQAKAVPEPASIFLVLFGGLVLFLGLRKAKSSSPC